MNTKKKGKPRHLGRGLQSLLGSTKPEIVDTDEPVTASGISGNFPPDKELEKSLREIRLVDISTNPYQPRNVWDEKEMEDLAASIRANGIIQPIVVRKTSSGYQIIAGERRLRAAKMAGLNVIPSLVRKATDKQMLELALIENIHRTNLNPIERARAYQTYLNTFSFTQAEAAERLGENRSVIANHMRLLDLPEDMKQMLAKGILTMGHARAILSLPTDEVRRKLANRAMAGRLSVRVIERLVRKHLEGIQEVKKLLNYKPPHIIDMEKKLTNELGTKVIIEARKNGQQGKIIIEFYSLDDFERISEQMGIETAETV